MTTSGNNPGAQVKEVSFPSGEETLSVELMDGRTIKVPLAWYPKLLHAAPEQRENWEICGGGLSPTPELSTAPNGKLPVLV